MVKGNAYDKVEQEAPQVPANPLAGQVTNAELRSAFQVLAQAMTIQANREVVVSVNPNVGTSATRVRDFTIINPPEFHGSKVEEDPQGFTDEVYNFLMIMGVTPKEKSKLATLST
uniref:Polyprotein n=1 Tax=Solanum tuberosum TaxID=4113 RepID=M1DII5_SOLTU